MSSSLPVSRQVHVSVNLTPLAAQAQDLNTLLILGSSNVIDPVERFRDYESIDDVAVDFGLSAPEYLASVAYFGQSPQPGKVKIGRWLENSSSGALKGGTLSAAQQLLSGFTAITSGGFTYSKNGAGPTNVTGINLSGAANLNAVASLITAALSGAVMIWNAGFSRFELTSTATGNTSAISFLTAPGSGSDLSGLLGMTAASGGAYLVPGASAESAAAAVALFDLQFGQRWYGLTFAATTLSQSDHLAVASFIEATNTKHIYGVSTQDAGVLVGATTTDIASVLSLAGYNKTLAQFSSTTPYSVASLLGRVLTVDFNGNNTTITAAFKQEPGVTPEFINSTQADALKAKHCNALLEFNNDTAIILNGVMSSGEFIDTVTGTDWVAVRLQTDIYNLLFTSPTKIPQTDAGVHLLVTTAEAVGVQAVNNGLAAPGIWNSGGFGALSQGDYLAKGFYVFAQRVGDQNTADRAARKAPPIQMALKLAGAIHDVTISVLVNQ